MNKKGQAALTDALFFLLIVVAVCVLLFRYSSTYGLRIQDSLNDFYFKEYSNSTMRTLFYMTVPNDINLSYDYPETDYLMTIVKQDYYYNNKIGPDSADVNSMWIDSDNNRLFIAKYHLYNSLKIIMQPLENYDYIFYIYSPSSPGGDQFPFFLFKKTGFQEDTIDNLTGTVTYDIQDTNYYLCNPSDYTQVRNIFSKAGKISSSTIPLRFQSGTTDLDATSLFALWPSSASITDDDISTLNCKKIDID